MRSGPPLGRLPSGRHRLTRDEVVASQRRRLLVAVAATVADKGYMRATVADFVERAAVSRSTFYEQFADKEAAFLATWDFAAEVVLARIREADASLPGDAGWRERVRSALETYLAALAAEPDFARAIHVESLAAGPAALERRAATLALFTERTRRAHQRARREERGVPELPEEAFHLHTGGIDELIRECLRTRGPNALPALAEPAVRATFALFGAPRR